MLPLLSREFRKKKIDIRSGRREEERREEERIEENRREQRRREEKRREEERRQEGESEINIKNEVREKQGREKEDNGG